MRNAAAGLTARTLATLTRLRGGGATSLPGFAALRVDPGFIKRRAKLLAGSVVVTGTNGKTTTARFVAAALESDGRSVVHNQSGSNLLRGIASALAAAPKSSRKPWGLFEVDEATMPAACQELKPRVVVVTNLFRDQLDRYGELKRTAALLRQGLQALPASSTLLLNADDPLVATLGKGLRCTVRYFGIEDTAHSRPRLPHAADAVSDPKSGELLSYQAVFVGHLGHYRGKTLRRPKPHVRLTGFSPKGAHGAELLVASGRQKVELTLSVPGTYNAYNALAALAASAAAGIPLAKAAEAVAGTAAVFGRLESIEIDDKNILVSLIKNPTGANEVIQTLAEDRRRKRFLILINDNFADGLDVSWLWDTDFETLAAQADRISVGGLRADDMALRLKYAGFDPTEVTVHESISNALEAELAAVPPGGTLHVLPTYTAMLELRRTLTKRGNLKHYLD